MIGFGYDSHRFSPEGKLFIGGIEIDCGFGVVAHSDGDVLIHALIDSLLGACGMGDIGEHFPDNDSQFKNIDSKELLKKTINLVHINKMNIVNIDATIILEHPKLAGYKAKIKSQIAEICCLLPEQVNIKAKSNEKMGFIGRGEGVAAFCVCQVEKN